VNSADQERFNRIRRETGCGYGITLKDLAWLVRLVEKLEAISQLPVVSSQPHALVGRTLLATGAESINTIRKRSAQLEAATARGKKRRKRA
jgi:hypothetical protein